MRYYISIDSYMRHPRNFFGFKKKGAQPERCLAALSLMAEEVISRKSNVWSGAVRGAKLNDDPETRGRYYSDMDYDKVAEQNIGFKAIMHMREMDGENETEPEIFTIDKPSRYHTEVLWHLMGLQCTNLYDVEREVVSSLPDEYFMFDHTNFETFINLPDGGKYTTEEKMDMFHSHRRYPKMYPTDDPITRSNKAYNLHRIIREAKARVFTMKQGGKV